MKVSATICMLLLSSLSIPIDQANAQSVWVLDKIYVGDPTPYCGPSPFPDWLPKPFPDTLTRKCSRQESGLDVTSTMTLNFTYPAVITLQNPGTFEATAILTFSHFNNNYDSGAFFELELEGDHRLPTPECHKKVDNWKELPRGQQVSEETLELNAFCAFDIYWGWGDDPVFEFEVDSTISGVSQHFYLWLYYKEATDQGPFTLTINKKGSCSGTVTSISPGINCGNDCTRLYPSGTQVTLTASPDSQCLPSEWRWVRSDGGNCSNNSDCEVIMNQDVTVDAYFERPELTIDTGNSSGNGLVHSDPQGISCRLEYYYDEPGCFHHFDYNTTVTLTALTDAKTIFSGWSGGGCSGKEKCIVIMKEDLLIEANFFINPVPFIFNSLLLEE